MPTWCARRPAPRWPSELDIGEAVIFGGSRSQQRALLTVNVLGDVCEALIAAIYLDGGYEAAHRFVEVHWRDRMLEAPLGGRNAKSALQEWAQAEGHGTPSYEIAGRTGPDHAPTFVVSVRIGELAAGARRGPQPARGGAGRRRGRAGARGRMDEAR